MHLHSISFSTPTPTPPGFHLGNLVGLVLSPLVIAAVGWKNLFVAFGLLGLPLLAFWVRHTETTTRCRCLYKCACAVCLKIVFPVTHYPIQPSTHSPCTRTPCTPTPHASPPLLQNAVVVAPPPRPAPAAPDAAAPPATVSVARLIASPRTWAIVIANCVNHWGYFLFLNWLPAYFFRTLGLDLKASSLMSFLPWLAMAIGSSGEQAGSDWEWLRLFLMNQVSFIARHCHQLTRRDREPLTTPPPHRPQPRASWPTASCRVAWTPLRCARGCRRWRSRCQRPRSWHSTRRGPPSRPRQPWDCSWSCWGEGLCVGVWVATGLFVVVLGSAAVSRCDVAWVRGQDCLLLLLFGGPIGDKSVCPARRAQSLGQAGFVANMSDIAPTAAGKMFGLCNTFGSLSGVARCVAHATTSCLVPPRGCLKLTRRSPPCPQRHRRWQDPGGHGVLPRRLPAHRSAVCPGRRGVGRAVLGRAAVLTRRHPRTRSRLSRGAEPGL